MRPPQVALPRGAHSPLRGLLVRVAVASSLLLAVALIAWLDRGGYVDAAGGEISFLDTLYYATVSVTTTGYGDIRPETDQARLISTVFVTPMRVLFLVVLVGTTLELLAERTREGLRVERWRRRVRDHVIICGYGTKGRSAAKVMLARGTPAQDVVVIDENPDVLRDAARDGFATICGSASRTDVLQSAEIDRARTVVVAPFRDDTAVLVTLTAREHNPTATIVAAVREEENAHLLHQSGADSVILSSAAAGRLLGLATQTPRLVEVLEDLLSVGEGLDIVEEEVLEPGPLADVHANAPVLAVVRGEQILRFDAPEAAQLRLGDRLVMLRSHAA